MSSGSTPARPVQPKVRQPGHLRVGDFFDRHQDELKLKLINTHTGLDRLISEPTVNRPGLALAGFYMHFAKKRIQVIGNQEFAYLESRPATEQRQRFSELCHHELPCLIVCRGLELSKPLVRIADESGVSVFQTSMRTMKLINAATIALEMDFAPSVSEHGSMVDVRGIGILIRGSSGTGKSETVLSLVERGHSLVADDLVHLRALEGREIIGSAPEQGRYYMEVRGLGIINIPALYGIAAMRLEKRLDLVVNLVPGVHIERPRTRRRRSPAVFDHGNRQSRWSNSPCSPAGTLPCSSKLPPSTRNSRASATTARSSSTRIS